MAKKTQKRSKAGAVRFAIRDYRDVHEVSRLTLESYFNQEISRERASTIFTGARTMAITAKIILEANHLGVKSIAGLGIDQAADVIEFNNDKAKQLPGDNG